MARVRSKAAALFVASAAVLFTTACGGGSDTSSTDNAGGGPNGGGNAAFTAYLDCMKTNGVTVTLPSGGARPRPSEGGPGGYPSGRPRPSGSAGMRGGGFPGGGFAKPAGVDDATWQKAQAACASLRPSFGGGGGRNRGNGMNAAYRNCLKEHGVTQDGGKLDTADPTVKKAMETCKVLQPSASPSA